MIDTETIIAGNKMDFQNALNAAEHDPEQKISARRCSSGTSKEVTVYSIVCISMGTAISICSTGMHI